MGERQDKAAWFKSTILPHEAALRRHLRRLMSPFDVDDTISEVFTRAYTAADWSRITSGKAYLFAIARNLILDNARRQKVVAFESYADIDTLQTPDGHASPEAQVSVRDELRALQAAIDDLPPKCREVFLLRRVEELSVAQVGDRLGLAVKTVERHMTRALAQLTRTLAQSDTLSPADSGTRWRTGTRKP